MWASPFVKTVELALKLKGIPYDYVEENLRNKCPLLLKLNPAHQKVPVLVHNGKPIAESLVILEYIDETWKTGPQLLPVDPYKRSQVRFWAGFLQQIFESMVLLVKTSGEAQAKAIKKVLEKLKLLEEGLKDLHPNGSVDIHSVGLLEVVIFSHFGSYEAQEEVLGVKFLDLEKFPLLFSCIAAMIEIPVAKAALNPHEKAVAFLKFIRENSLKSCAE